MICDWSILAKLVRATIIKRLAVDFLKPFFQKQTNSEAAFL